MIHSISRIPGDFLRRSKPGIHTENNLISRFDGHFNIGVDSLVVQIEQHFVQFFTQYMIELSALPFIKQKTKHIRRIAPFGKTSDMDTKKTRIPAFRLIQIEGPALVHMPMTAKTILLALLLCTVFGIFMCRSNELFIHVLTRTLKYFRSPRQSTIHRQAIRRRVRAIS
jgi:hypothetical protein